jgi:hypothetical protein
VYTINELVLVCVYALCGDFEVVFELLYTIRHEEHALGVNVINNVNVVVVAKRC